jgi:hypothetical protein
MMANEGDVKKAATAVAKCRHPSPAFVALVEVVANDPGHVRYYELCLDCGSTRWSNRAGMKSMAWRKPGLVVALLRALEPRRVVKAARRKHTPLNPNACPICAPIRCEVARRKEQRGLR